jgi:hypothetical protein
MRNLRSGIAISVFVLLAACGHKAASTTPPASGGGTAAAAAPVTLVSLTSGDRACYVAFKGADGKEISQEGSFELCQGGGADASALIGKQVTFTSKKENVLAASCEGNMDCGKSDEVDLIETITAAP